MRRRGASPWEGSPLGKRPVRKRFRLLPFAAAAKRPASARAADGRRQFFLRPAARARRALRPSEAAAPCRRAARPRRSAPAASRKGPAAASGNRSRPARGGRAPSPAVKPAAFTPGGFDRGGVAPEEIGARRGGRAVRRLPGGVARRRGEEQEDAGESSREGEQACRIARRPYRSLLSPQQQKHLPARFSDRPNPHENQ